MLLALSLLGCPKPATTAPTQEVSMAAKARPHTTRIPRTDLFGNPQVSQVSIAPDGSMLAWLAPDEGVMNIWVAPPYELEKKRVLTSDRHRGIPGFFWSADSSSVLFVNDTDGDENFHVFKVPADGGESTDLTPIDGVRVQILRVSEKHPGTIWIGLNDRDPALHDVYSLDLETGERTLVQQNDDGYAGFEIDHDGQVRLAGKPTADGGMDWFRKVGDAFEPLTSVGMEDSLTTHLIAFDGDNSTVYMEESRDRNTAALVAWNLETDEKKVLGEDPRADYSYALWHPTEHRPLAAAFEFDRVSWQYFDAQVEADLKWLSEAVPGELDVVSSTDDNETWVVLVSSDDQPSRYVLYNRHEQSAPDLFVTRPALVDQPLARMHPRVLKTRDGLDMVSYLTLPVDSDPDADGKPDQPVPMVLLVHGGPWSRDSWGFDRMHQLLANRGYAVLSPNFRGSTGFGKDFINAADRKWGTQMHDDLLDAVDWAVEQGITDRESVAIMGGSYGGYATLAGMTFTPDTFACGVDVVGPSNLITLLESIPPYWKPMLENLARRVGDPRTEEGRALLTERSPLTKVDAISKPLLIGQGANDPRVKQAEADQIVEAMKARDIPVAYVLFPDEGHGFRKPENNLAFWGTTEAFLSTCLGGAYEPIDLTGSSMQVPEATLEIPGLQAALDARGE